MLGIIWATSGGTDTLWFVTSTPPPEPGIDAFWLDVSSQVVAQVIGWGVIGILTVIFLKGSWRRALLAGVKTLGLSAARLFRWLSGLRVTTRAGRSELGQGGYDLRSQEVDLERSRAFEPRWRIDTRDKLNTRDLYWLENAGYEVSDVGMTCDPDLFASDGDIAWDGSFGSDSHGSYEGKWFKGVPTERGKVEGVAFRVSWRDRHGDPHVRDVHMLPADIRAGRDTEIEEAVERGRQEGREQAIQEQEAAGPQPPLPLPRWRIYFNSPPSDGDETSNLILENSIDRSVAREVRVDGYPKWFTMTTAGHFTDLSGESQGAFSGILSHDADRYGCIFTITWYDEKAQRREANYELPATLPDDYY